MVNFFRLSQPVIKETVSKSLLVGVVSGAVFFSGLTPTVQRHSFDGSATLVFSNAAYAQQAITAEEIVSYVRSLIAIEPIRQVAYEEIKRILGTGEVPAIACHRRNSLNSLDRRIRQIAVRYCNRSIQIVESNHLSINRFNTITVARQTDPNLADRIRQALIRAQQDSP